MPIRGPVMYSTISLLRSTKTNSIYFFESLIAWPKYFHVPVGYFFLSYLGIPRLSTSHSSLPPSSRLTCRSSTALTADSRPPSHSSSILKQISEQKGGGGTGTEAKIRLKVMAKHLCFVCVRYSMTFWIRIRIQNTHPYPGTQKMPSNF